jgi:hypothetical protein
LLLSFIGCTALHASDEQTRLLRKFRNTRPASPPLLEHQTDLPNLSIRIDEVFYPLIKDLANDLRIINTARKNIPFVLNRVTGTTTVVHAQQLSGKIIRRQPLPDGRTVIDFELDSPHRSITALELVGSKFSPGAQLTIAIGEGTKLQTAVDKLPISDTSHLPMITNRRYQLPQAFAGKLIRLTVSNGKINEFDAVRVYTSIARRQPETALTSEYRVMELERKSSDSVTEILLQSNYLPLTQLKLNTTSNFYFCKITVAASDDRQNWSTNASGTVHRVDLDTQQTVDFQEIRSKYMLIKIEHTHGKALENLHLQVYGNTYEWLLQATAETLQNLTIYYNAAERIPRQQQNPDITSRQAVKFYQLGTPSNNPLYQAGVNDSRSWRYLVGSLVITFCGISAAVLLIRLPKQKKVLPED